MWSYFASPSGKGCLNDNQAIFSRIFFECLSSSKLIIVKLFVSRNVGKQSAEVAVWGVSKCPVDQVEWAAHWDMGPVPCLSWQWLPIRRLRRLPPPFRISAPRTYLTTSTDRPPKTRSCGSPLALPCHPSGRIQEPPLTSRYVNAM